MTGTLRPRVALVVGGGGDIGGAIGRALAGQGRSVAVADLRLVAAEAVAAGLALAPGAGCLAVECDVADPGSVNAALGAVSAGLGPVEILVNAAGWDEFVPFVETGEDFWARVIDVNYTGVLRTSAAVLGPMIEAGWGRIVNIGSDAGRVGSSLESVYAGAKGAVIAFTKSVAREVARHGITANTVCPGPTDTAMIRGMAARREGGEGMVEALTKAIPLRRLAHPDDIARAVAFFTADEASYVTGQTLSISGGLTMS